MYDIFPEDPDVGPIDHSPPENRLPPISVVGGVPHRACSNPWQQDVPEKVGRLKGLPCWLFVSINGMFVVVFSILFTRKFLEFLWQLCLDTIFAKPWSS